MIPWPLIDTARIPGGDVLSLRQRGTEFAIMIGGAELMNSRRGGSEEALATLSLGADGRAATHACASAN